MPRRRKGKAKQDTTTADIGHAEEASEEVTMPEKTTSSVEEDPLKDGEHSASADMIEAFSKRKSLLISDGETVTTIEQDHICIAIMGRTGMGKSSFIADCTGKSVQDDMIGYSMHSHTKLVAIYTLKYVEHTIHLIDTPGFDDTNLTDTEVLSGVAQFLHKTYSEDIQLDGVIYFHSMTDNKMTGRALKNLKVFKKICGDGPLKRVVLATTMWDIVPIEDGNRRENELVTDPMFWKGMKDLGSEVERVIGKPGTPERRLSAMNIIKKFVLKKEKIVLSIQEEMEEGMLVSDTSAGKEVLGDILKERKKHETELREIKEQMEVANDQERKALQGQKDVYTNLIKGLDADKETLNMSIAEMNKRNEDLVKALASSKLAHQEDTSKLRSEMERRIQDLERGLRDEREAIKKERAEFETKSKAQKQTLAAFDTTMDKKVKQLEADYARQLKELQREKAQQLGAASPMASGSLIVPMMMIGMFSILTGGLGGGLVGLGN